MRYYNITESTSPNIIGSVYPQMECIDLSVKDGLDTISVNKGKEVTDVGEIHNLRLHKKSKLTDVISCSLGAGGDFIISEKLYFILKQFQISSVQFFPISFEHKGEIYPNYKFVHFIYRLEKFIDFTRSVYDDYFIKGINENKPADYKKFSDLVNEHKKLNHFRLTSTVIQEGFPQDDLFVLSFANQKKYISESLMEKLIEEKITGIDIVAAGDLK